MWAQGLLSDRAHSEIHPRVMLVFGFQSMGVHKCSSPHITPKAAVQKADRIVSI